MRLMLRIVSKFVMLHIAVVLHGMPVIRIVALMLHRTRIVAVMLHIVAVMRRMLCNAVVMFSVPFVFYIVAETVSAVLLGICSKS